MLENEGAGKRDDIRSCLAYANAEAWPKICLIDQFSSISKLTGFRADGSVQLLLDMSTSRC